jgi:hypothetical protein
MTINIQKASNVNVDGRHRNNNCKAVYNITTGEIYSSGLDAANALGIDPSCISAVLIGKSKTCKGMRFCFVSKIMEHLDEITEQNRIRIAKVAAYDAMIAEQAAKQKAQENLAKHRAKCDELRAKLDKEMQLLQAAEALCNN